MRYPLQLDKTHIKIFHEGRKRRIFVGDLIYDVKKDKYCLQYDKNYTLLKQAIPLGPNLSLFQLTHHSKKSEMFPVFLDRIPDKLNPAYPEYCESQGILPDEKKKPQKEPADSLNN